MAGAAYPYSEPIHSSISDWDGRAALPDSRWETSRACTSNCGNGTTLNGSPMNDRLAPKSGCRRCWYSGLTCDLSVDTISSVRNGMV